MTSFIETICDNPVWCVVEIKGQFFPSRKYARLLWRRWIDLVRGVVRGGLEIGLLQYGINLLCLVNHGKLICQPRVPSSIISDSSSVSSSVNGLYQALTLLFYPFGLGDNVEGWLATTASEVLGSSSGDEKLCHEWVRCSYFRGLGFGLDHSWICSKFLMLRLFSFPF